VISGSIHFLHGSTSFSTLSSTGDVPRDIIGNTSQVLTVTSQLLFSGTNLTFTPAAGNTVTCSPITEKMNVRTNGVTFGTFRLNPPTDGQIVVLDGFTAATLFTTGPTTGTGTVSLNDAVTVTGTYTGTGNSTTNRIKVYGPTGGGTAAIGAATTSLTNVDLVNIIQAGAAAWTGTSKTNTFTGYRNYVTST
jgi:hypothetical protein